MRTPRGFPLKSVITYMLLMSCDCKIIGSPIKEHFSRLINQLVSSFFHHHKKENLKIQSFPNTNLLRPTELLMNNSICCGARDRRPPTTIFKKMHFRTFLLKPPLLINFWSKNEKRTLSKHKINIIYKIKQQQFYF